MCFYDKGFNSNNYLKNEAVLELQIETFGQFYLMFLKTFGLM